MQACMVNTCHYSVSIANLAVMASATAGLVSGCLRFLLRCLALWGRQTKSPYRETEFVDRWSVFQCSCSARWHATSSRTGPPAIVMLHNAFLQWRQPSFCAEFLLAWLLQITLVRPLVQMVTWFLMTNTWSSGRESLLHSLLQQRLPACGFLPQLRLTT